MTRTCTVCGHDLHHEINVALVSPSRSYRAIAGQYGVSKAALQRHAGEHLPKLLVKSTRGLEVARADDLLGTIERMIGRLEAFIDRAEEAEDGDAFLDHVAEWRKHIELLAKIAGQLAQEGQVNIHLSPQWVKIEATIVSALAPYPEAAAAVATALEEVPNGRH